MSVDPVYSQPFFSRKINHNILQSEIDGGVYIDNIPEGTFLRIRMLDHTAILSKKGKDDYLIWGHPEFYPSPIKIAIDGSIWCDGGLMIKHGFIGLGMRLVFVRLDRPPDVRVAGEYLVNYSAITTAQILEIEEIDP